jgi:hypothetical protein
MSWISLEHGLGHQREYLVALGIEMRIILKCVYRDYKVGNWTGMAHHRVRGVIPSDLTTENLRSSCITANSPRKKSVPYRSSHKQHTFSVLVQWRYVLCTAHNSIETAYISPACYSIRNIRECVQCFTFFRQWKNAWREQMNTLTYGRFVWPSLSSLESRFPR